MSQGARVGPRKARRGVADRKAGHDGRGAARREAREQRRDVERAAAAAAAALAAARLGAQPALLEAELALVERPDLRRWRDVAMGDDVMC